jgi:urease beta subunit
VSAFRLPEPVIPGEVQVQSGGILLNEARETVELLVRNVGDRPIQVGSHFHFADTNSGLDFDRSLSLGFRLDIAAGTSARFEPGVSRVVRLVRFAGNRFVPGLQLRTAGPGPGRE